LERDKLDELVREMAAAFQESVVEVMTVKLLGVAEKYHARGLILAGGVAANTRLRHEVVLRSPLPVIIPEPVLCTDNGAMIATCAYYQYHRDAQFGLDLDVEPGLSLG
jgi:N6-L-threonylcarbamoyladenine synthase